MESLAEEAVIDISNAPIGLIVPACEKTIDRLYNLSFVSFVQYRHPLLRIGIPILANLIKFTSCFALLIYPNYYPTQGYIYTLDLILGVIVYNYLFYLHTRWGKAACHEETNVSKTVGNVTMSFYVLYMLYWFYFAVIQFYTHRDEGLIFQFGNVLMSSSWYLFFSTIAASYYFICVKLSQRSAAIHKWLEEIRLAPPQIDEFYKQYDHHYERTQLISGYWNLLILIGLLLQTCHVPIDFLTVVYERYYYDSFGLIIKMLSLLWYILRICELNDCEGAMISYLHEHRLYSFDTLKEIKTYSSYRPLGLDFYGIKVNKSFIVKLTLIVVNLVLPLLYTLISNKFFTT